MLGIVIKYFFIILCSIIIYKKLQCISWKTTDSIFGLLFSTVFAFTAYLTRQHFTYYTLITIVFLLVIFLYFSCKKTLNETITYTILSVGISYIFYITSSFIVGPTLYLFFKNLNKNIFNTVSYFMVGLLQISFSYLLFKIKRLKKGISTYETQLKSDFGVFTSISLLLIASLFNNQKNTNISGTIVLFCVILTGTLLMLWCKKHIGNIYLEKVHKRNIEILENSLSEEKEINERLMKHNEELSKIIHRDNKMIPAMLFAVEEILKCESVDEQKEKSKSLLNQLKTMSAERTGIITEYENINKKLPETGIASVDASIKYLFCKAKECDIYFEMLAVSNISNLDDIVSEDDLNTLVLDLGENAIIATYDVDSRNILIVLGYEHQNLTLSIYDSGNYFEQRIIDNLGVKRVTTHKESGGTGIGLMTTFEILKKYKASFTLDEKIDNNKYSKKISVCFDGCNRHRINTHNNSAVGKAT